MLGASLLCLQPEGCWQTLRDLMPLRCLAKDRLACKMPVSWTASQKSPPAVAMQTCCQEHEMSASEITQGADMLQAKRLLEHYLVASKDSQPAITVLPALLQQ